MIKYKLPFDMVDTCNQQRDVAIYKVDGSPETLTMSGACFADLAREYDGLDEIKIKINRSILPKHIIVKWFDYLNDAYGKEIFLVDFKELVAHVMFKELAPSNRKRWKQFLNLFGLVRYVYEEGKPNVVLGALYLKDRYPESDLMHCISCSDSLIYGKYMNNWRNSGHSLYYNLVPALTTFKKFISKLKIGDIHRAATDDLSSTLSGVDGVVETVKVGFNSGEPKEIIKKIRKEMKKKYDFYEEQRKRNLEKLKENNLW